MQKAKLRRFFAPLCFAQNDPASFATTPWQVVHAKDSSGQKFKKALCDCTGLFLLHKKGKTDKMLA